MPASCHTLRLILGDQLNSEHSWYRETREDVLYLLMELRQETDYVKHHIQKVAGFFGAMRAFAAQLEDKGHHVLYISLDHPENTGSLEGNLDQLLAKHEPSHFEYQLPDEYRLDQQLKKYCQGLSMDYEAVDTEHFLTDRSFLKNFFEGKKTYLMETFYREMRRRFDILMEPDGKTPLTGKWNYDAANRKKLPASVSIPERKRFLRDMSEMVGNLREAGIQTIGRIEAEEFDWPLTREEGLELLQHFLKRCLPSFGTYQDAMTTRDTLLFHSRLSFLMNVKLLHPLEVVKAVESHWKDHQDSIDIAQAEGFIRQIIGWREYMRGIYWAKMPAYANLNYFDHKQALPEWYWTGDTRMQCLKAAIDQSLDEAYAHHIQRLMVTGNFALLLGVDPDEVDSWYLGIYMDAIEWVEITNTRGMSQFADGGIVGTKPYVSSANYIHKMSDYCKGCYYDKKKKYGERACPFNSLYWDFYNRHEDKLGRNPRIGMMYRLWEKMDAGEKEKILAQAEEYKENVNQL
jgi:deoxyribodipyrimidine photolyase-related protein